MKINLNILFLNKYYNFNNKSIFFVNFLNLVVYLNVQFLLIFIFSSNNFCYSFAKALYKIISHSLWPKLLSQQARSEYCQFLNVSDSSLLEASGVKLNIQF